MLRPIKRTNIAEEIAEQLILTILRGDIKPGDRLPSEQEMMEQLGVGRSSVREAIRSLSVMGLVDVRQGNGAFVRDDSGFFAKAIARGSLMSPKTRQQLIEVREIIEAGIASLAAARATEQDIALLRATLEEMRASLDDPERCLDLDLTFHLTLADITQNAILYEIILSIRELMKKFIQDNLRAPGSTAAALHDHQRILDAVEQGDPAVARDAMLAHLRGVIERHPIPTDLYID
jgi:GntR family transcriptional repressor for pyruvate dehydrogenase complex